MTREEPKPYPGLVAVVAAVAVLTMALTFAETTEPRRPGERDKCPVCGMFVSPYPEWIAQVVFEDGSTAFFDGSKDLFRYLADRARFLPDKRDIGIDGIFVTSYYESQLIPARRALFVSGSDVIGPMGAELVPHGTREEAEEFMRDHGGSGIVDFDGITTELLRSLK